MTEKTIRFYRSSIHLFGTSDDRSYITTFDYRLVVKLMTLGCLAFSDCDGDIDSKIARCKDIL